MKILRFTLEYDSMIAGGVWWVRIEDKTVSICHHGIVKFMHNRSELVLNKQKSLTIELEALDKGRWNLDQLDTHLMYHMIDLPHPIFFYLRAEFGNGSMGQRFNITFKQEE